jgi:hypothetical protein
MINMEQENKEQGHKNTGSCFKCNAPSIDSIVHLGHVAMDTKDLNEEMGKNSPFGAKLRRIAEKVGAL